MAPDKPKREFPIFIVYLGVGLVVLGLLAWSFTRMLRTTDTRQAVVELPGQGFVTVSFTTDPFPPLPSGVVRINVMGMNSVGVMADLGPGVPFSFGAAGSDAPMGSGTAMPLGDGNYQAGVQFPVPGTYWLQFEISGRTARFNVRVEPAQ